MAEFVDRAANLSEKKRALLELRLQRASTRAHAVGRRERDAGPVPPSFAQQRLWFLDQFAPGNAVYNVPWVMRLAGPLNAAAFERAFNEVVCRHEVLRTTFATANDDPVQVIAPALRVPLALTDLTGLPPAERESTAHRLATEEARRPFNLAWGPLLRCGLLRLGDADHMLLLTLHHIVADGWSMGILMRELGVLYAASINGRRPELPAIPIQYADFAAWQRRWLVGEVLEEQLAYWRDRLGRNLPVLDLPSDRPRPAALSFRGTGRMRALPAGLFGALDALSRQEGVTPFMTALAAFLALLHRYTGQDDVVIGSAIAGRNRAEIEPLIGFFVNMLVLRTDLSGDPTFRELLQRVREVALGAYAHQDLPFEKIVDALKPERDPSRTPLFQVSFTLQDAPPRAIEFSGLRASFPDIDAGTSRFDLSVNVARTAEGFIAAAEYSTDLFDQETIDRLLRHFQTVLEGAVADPDRRLSRLPVLDAAEQKLMLVDWNATRRDFPPLCVHELVQAQAERTPEGAAAAFAGRALTYGELNRRANQLAHHLRRLGVGPEVLVGICVERSLEMVVGLLGVLKAGGAYVPLDPAHPRRRMAFMLQDARVPVLLTQEHLVPSLPECAARIIRLDADWGSIAGERDDNPQSGATPENPAYVIYTSGSTGVPKGVVVCHRGLANLACTQEPLFQIHPDSRVLQFTTLCFDVSAWEVFLTLVRGATLVLAPADELRDPQALAALLEREAVSVALLLPSVLSQLPLDAGPALQTLVSGAEVCPGALAGAWAARLPLVNAYGPTEATVCCTGWLVSGVDAGKMLAIGRPLPNSRIYILDAHMQPVPVGVVGEIFIGGAGLARGYLHRPDLTGERFIPDPLGGEPGARLYRTGDLARFLGDGNIEFAGRIDNQVKIRGFRVELGEVEAVLNQHPAVRGAVAAVREHDPQDKRLVAWVAAAAGGPPSAADLREFLRERLPDYMAPSAFVFLDELPLGPTGKVDRGALPAPDAAGPRAARSYVAPRTPVEELLAGIWAGVLGVERVGADDNFFELGGHSLLATRIVGRVRKALHCELSLRDVFEAPTVAGVARVIAGRGATGDGGGTALDLLLQVEGLSEEEALRLLESKVRAKENPVQ